MIDERKDIFFLVIVSEMHLLRFKATCHCTHQFKGRPCSLTNLLHFFPDPKDTLEIFPHR